MKLFYYAAWLAVLIAGALWLNKHPYFRIASIDIVPAEEGAKLQYANKEKLFERVRPGLTGSFFSVDVGRAQSIVQSDPWVADAKAERVPPHTIRIRVSEHKPFARWLRDNEHAGLVDDKGRIFQAAYDAELPEFDGESRDMPLMIENYRAFSTKLQPLRLKILRLQYSPRSAWTLMLDNGVEVRLGRENIHHRIGRFAESWSGHLAAHAHALDYVDMRYKDGFAVGYRSKSERPALPKDDDAEAPDTEAAESAAPKNNNKAQTRRR